MLTRCQIPLDADGEVTAMGYRVVVDFDLCESNARCMDAAPEVFEVRDDDFLYILDETPPDEIRAKVEEAVRLCPKAAITIADDA
jgi:ferredoxin